MTSRRDENRKLATVYLNLRGAKKKPQDWIEIAKTVRWAIDRYGSSRLAAEKLGYSYELIRTIASLLTLPPDVQDMVRDRRILYDAAQRLARVKGPERQRTIAKAIAGMPSHDARQVIQLSKRFPDANPSAFKSQVAASKRETQHVQVLILPLRDATYKALKSLAVRRGLSTERFALEVLTELVAAGRDVSP
jgi:hypothetical protein